jgi:hypothetical protein
VERLGEGEVVGKRLRGLIVLGVVLAAGIFIGSAVSQWSPLPEQERVAPQLLNSTAAGLGRVRVEVLNAGGTEGMARLATDHLRDRGFDVVYFGNADTFGQDSTVVLDRSARPRAAAAVGQALGTLWVESRPDANLYLDVTVMLGSDWAPDVSEIEDVGGESPWWDVRRFLR